MENNLWLASPFTKYFNAISTYFLFIHAFSIHIASSAVFGTQNLKTEKESAVLNRAIKEILLIFI
jgi:hypothetical protein